MIAVSNDLKNNCNNPSNVYREYIVIGSDTVEIKGKMSNTAYKDTTFFGTFNMKMLTFTTENDIEYKKKEFVYYKEVDGEAFKIGTYIVTEVNESDTTEEITVTAMDYGLKFAIPYVSTLDYAGGTITLMDVLTEICTNCSVTLENVTLDNGTFIVDSNQFTGGELCGDVISAIAMISGNFAVINDSDKLEFLLSNATSEIIEDYVELEDKRDTHPITSVALGLSATEGEETVLEDDELIAEYGEHWLVINDNPFAYTEEKREELITAIFNKVKGFEYSSFVSKYSFKPYMQLGDLIQFRNKNGDLVDSIILKIDTDYDDIELSAPSIVDATVDYVKPERASVIAKRAEIIVNKQEATITSTVETVTSLSTSVTNLEEVTGTNEEAITTLQTDLVNDYTTTNELQEELDTRDNNIIETLSTQITETAEDLQISIIEDINTNGVSKLTNTLVTIDIDGIKVAVNTSAFNTLLNNVGLYCKDGSTIVAQFDKDGGLIKNLIVQGSITFPSITLIEYTDADSELGLGHFWNGA